MSPEWKPKLCYSARAIGSAIGMDRQQVIKLFGTCECADDCAGIPRRQGKFWISDIKKHMPHFFESWMERMCGNFYAGQSAGARRVLPRK